MKPTSLCIRRNAILKNNLKRTYATQIIYAPPPNRAIVEKENSISSIIANNSRGTGGRNSISGIVATVFGASGFLGKYVVNELGKIGSQVVIPYRGEESAQRHLKILGDLGQIVPLQCDVYNPESIEEVISRSNVVVNLIGKRWKTANFSLEHVNAHIPANIAKIAKKVGVEKFVHVSALGASPDSPSEWHRTKYQGELAVREVFPEAVIVRPGTVFGYEDRLLNIWARLASQYPFIPILKGYENRKDCYLSHIDFAQAMYRIIVDDNEGATYDIGGPETTFAEFIDVVLEATLFEKPIVPIPLDLALKVTNFSQYLRRSKFTVDEIKALTVDCVINPKHKTLNDLDMANPILIADAASKYIKHFRKPSMMMNAMYETK